MAESRERILNRLRQARAVRPPHAAPDSEPEAAWLARQPPVGDLAERFRTEQESVAGEVRRVASWEALPDVVVPWLAERGVQSVLVGHEPRLERLCAALDADGRFALHRYDRTLEESRETVFGVDCGITTSRGGIAETGSVIIVPTPEEPRLLSLAPEVHLAVVERERLHPRLADFIAGGAYQTEVPTNLVLVSGASRTADIELTLAMGVHGPKLFLVALVD
ncbi:MAG: lactate utilization protein [Gammaproteobacteria bacterium]|nr:lactate utilization protein [Gammaproteobacteria bacterium]